MGINLYFARACYSHYEQFTVGLLSLERKHGLFIQMLHHPMPLFLNYHDWHRSWFLQNLGREFLRLGRKRLHGRVDPSRHWAAITLQPTHELVVTPKTKSCRESEQKSWSAESLQTPSGSLQDHSVFADGRIGDLTFGVCGTVWQAIKSLGS